MPSVPRPPRSRRWVLLALGVAVLSSAAVLSARFWSGQPFSPIDLPPALAPHDSDGVLRVLYLGDFGAATPERDAVVKRIEAEHRARPFDLALEVGDNLYPCGPSLDLPGARDCVFEADGNTVDAGYVAPEDPQFAALFHRPLAGLTLADGGALTVHLALGNHDVGHAMPCRNPMASPTAGERARACLEVAHRGAGWSMPGRHYVVDTERARFVVFDSNFLSDGDYGGFRFSDELGFLKQALSGCGGRRCFLVSHHMPYAAGAHKEEVAFDAYQARVKEVEAAGHFDGWLAGHDHDMQHTRAPGGYDVFVSGSAAKLRDVTFTSTSTAAAKLLYGSSTYGAAVLEVWADGWAVRFFARDGQGVHCCLAKGSGPCEPIQCAAKGPSLP